MRCRTVLASRAAAVNSPLPVPSGPVDLWIFNLCLFIMLRFRLLTTSWSMDDAEPPVSSSSLPSELRSIGKEIKVLLGPALPGRAMNLLAEMPPPNPSPRPPALPPTAGAIMLSAALALGEAAARAFSSSPGAIRFFHSLWKCCSRGCFSVPSGAAAGGGRHNVN